MILSPEDMKAHHRLTEEDIKGAVEIAMRTLKDGHPTMAYNISLVQCLAIKIYELGFQLHIMEHKAAEERSYGKSDA